MKPPVDVTYRIDILAGGAGRTETPPAFFQCHMITRFDGWEVIVPLQFIPLEEPHD